MTPTYYRGGESEVGTIYVEPKDRWVVSLVVGYGAGGEEIDTAEDAAAAALSLTRDEGRDGTHWHVYDRRTGLGRFLEQEQFEGREVR